MTVRTIVTVSALLLGSLALGACSLSSSPTAPSSSSTGTSSTSPSSQTPEPTAVPTVKIESSGNVETDLQTMDKELSGLDANTDFPSFTQQDLEK